MTTALRVEPETIWNRKDGTTGRVEVLDTFTLGGEEWVRVRHLDMPAAKTKTWTSMVRRFLMRYEPADL